MAQTIKLRRSATQGAIPTISQLSLGEVAVNTYDGKMYIKKSVGGTETIVEIGGGSDAPITSSFTLYEYTASASQTTFSGSDDNSNTLAYDTGTPPRVLVYLNGVLLDYTTDYTAINGTSVVLTSAAASNDLVQIGAYKSTVTSDQSIQLDDNSKLSLGNDSDLELWHTGSNSVIHNKTGQLRVRADDLSLQSYTSEELFITALENGAVKLYYDNSLKLETTNDGVTVTGDVEADEFIGDVRGAILFKAQAGETLAKGEVVYISGISGNTTIVSKADADDASKMPAFGLVAAAASSGNPVDIYTNGILSEIDTSAYSEGDELFVSTTAGALTATPPTGESAALQKIGKVTRSNATSGSIFITGAGRSNAVPNLNEGKLFVGNSSNQAVADDTLHVDIANSRVGIGTSSPDAKLASAGVTGTTIIQALGADTNGFADVEIKSTGTSGASRLYFSDTAAQSGLIRYSHSTNSMEFTTATTERMRIDASGNVGIGTSSPAGELEVKSTSDADLYIRSGDSNAGSIYFASASDSQEAAIRYFNSNNSLRFYGHDMSEAMRIDSLGNLGIGVIPKTGGTTWQHVQFGGTGNLIARQSDSVVDALFSNNYYVNASNVDSYITTGAAARMFMNDNVISFDQATSGSTDTAITWSEAMRIDSAGNLLVGTTTNSDTRKLRVYGISEFDGNGVGLTIYKSSGTKIGSSGQGDYIVSGGPSDGFGIQSESQLVFGSGGITERARIDSSGRLGIGTSSPGGKLSIRATSFAGSDSHFGFGANNDIYLTYGSTGNTILRTIDGSGTNSEKMRITSDGRVGIGTTSPSGELEVKSTSDADLYIRSGDSNAGSIYFASASDSQEAAIRYFNSNNSLRFYGHDMAEAMRIDSSGNVGINTSSPVADSGYSSVTLDGSTGSQLFLRGAGTDRGLIWASSNFNIEAKSTTPMVFRTNATERMRIDSLGNVGIGTVPDVISSNATTLNIKSTVTTKGGALLLESVDESLKTYLYPSSTGTTLGTLTNHPLIFATNSAERMRIDSSGRILAAAGSAFVSNTTTTSTSKTLVNGEQCFVDTATQTVTLPASPSIGDNVTIFVGNFTDTTIARNGANIMSLAENLTVDVANTTVKLVYINASTGWRIA